MNSRDIAIQNIFIYEEAIENSADKRVTKSGIGPIRLAQQLTDKELLEYGDKCFEYNKFGISLDDLLDEPYPTKLNQSVIVRKNTPKIFEGILPNNLPITCTEHHLKQIVAAKSPDNLHLHGLSVALVKKIPELLETPVLIANDPGHSDRILVMISAYDNSIDKLPLLFPIKPNGFGVLEMCNLMTNHITTVYGERRGTNYFGTGLLEQDLIYLSSQGIKEIEELYGLDLKERYPHIPLDMKIKDPKISFDNRQNSIEKIITAIKETRGYEDSWTLIAPPYNNEQANYYSSLHH